MKIAILGSRILMAVFGAALVGLAGWPLRPHADQLNEDHTAWRLVSITSELRDRRGIDNGVVNIDELTANAQGGAIRLTMNGQGPCLGKHQRFRFTWRFDRDITNIAGNAGDVVMATTANLEGEPANCIDGNPFWKVGEYGELLGTTRGGWGTHSFKDPPNSLPGRMTLSIRLRNRTNEGVEISLGSNWAGDYSFAGLQLNVHYLYQALPNGGSAGGSSISGPVGGPVGGPTGGSTSGPNTFDAGGGRGRVAFCTLYANRAAQQNQQNGARRCGLSGPAWNSSAQYHYGWCMTVASPTAQAQDDARAAALARCVTPPQTSVGGRASYAGCFADRSAPPAGPGRDMTGFSVNHPAMSNGLCRKACYDRGFRYAATQYGSWCFCANAVGRYGQAANCNMPCSGGPGEICGGSFANSVYTTGR